MGTVVDEIADGQSRNPPVSECPEIARILISNEVEHLFIGSAVAASDSNLLKSLEIDGIVALGTGRLAATHIPTFCIDILDVEDAFLLEYLDDCLAFMDKQITEQRNLLVHCVYGQSRSAAICIAYLMKYKNLPLKSSYQHVQAARPCIYINYGYLQQLNLYQDMKCQLLGDTSAHATFRLQFAYQKRLQGKMEMMEVDALTCASSMSKKIYCKKCNFLLCSQDNATYHQHKSKTPSSSCGSIYLEPLPWMALDMNHGKLTCPRCKSKIGVYNWMGIKCTHGLFTKPAFQLSISRIDSR